MRKSLVVLLALAMVLGLGAFPVYADNTQVGGVGVLTAPGSAPCDDAVHGGADYALAMTGDLEGCIYGYITSFGYHENSGTYQERADEVFIGSWGDVEGSFSLTENFTGKFDPVTGDQIHGRCQHPINAGSGTEGFDGVSGRLDFKDDVDAGIAVYRGHLKLDS